MRSLTPKRLFAAALAAVLAGLLAFFWDDLAAPLRAVLVGGGVFALLTLLSASGRSPVEVLTAAGDLSGRLDMVEGVVADEARGPWNPTALPWVDVTSTLDPVLLVPAADYHLAEVVPLAHALERAGIPARIAIGPSPWGRTWPALAWYDEEVYALPAPEEIAGSVSAVLVMKDTGSLAPFVSRCRELGVFTLAKVEGAQDFWDADTPEARLPYRNVDLVLCQGDFDVEALSDRDTEVVGSTRLERLWWAPPVIGTAPMAVINLNFVYGVNTADRRLWLDTAIAGCEQAGVPYVISVHPAEKSRIDSERVTSISASRLLPRATVLISRFSTMPLEAMARGLPFVYHNPHGETVRTFSDPMGGFEVTASAAELASVLSDVDVADYRSRCEPFFLHHVDVEPERRSEQRAAATIAQRVTG